MTTKTGRELDALIGRHQGGNTMQICYSCEEEFDIPGSVVCLNCLAPDAVSKITLKTLLEIKAQLCAYNVSTKRP